MSVKSYVGSGEGRWADAGGASVVVGFSDGGRGAGPVRIPTSDPGAQSKTTNTTKISTLISAEPSNRQPSPAKSLRDSNDTGREDRTTYLSVCCCEARKASGGKLSRRAREQSGVKSGAKRGSGFQRVGARQRTNESEPCGRGRMAGERVARCVERDEWERSERVERGSGELIRSSTPRAPAQAPAGASGPESGVNTDPARACTHPCPAFFIHPQEGPFHMFARKRHVSFCRCPINRACRNDDAILCSG